MSFPVIPVYEGCMQGRITKIIRKTNNPFFLEKENTRSVCTIDTNSEGKNPRTHDQD